MCSREGEKGKEERGCCCCFSFLVFRTEEEEEGCLGGVLIVALVVLVVLGCVEGLFLRLFLRLKGEARRASQETSAQESNSSLPAVGVLLLLVVG